MINYNNRIFKSVSNTTNAEVSENTFFYYKQIGNILTAEYSGGKIKKGHLIGLVDSFGNINMSYHHINDNNQIMSGICQSIPEIMENNKIRLHETWQWTSGDRSSGNSIIAEK